MDTPTITPKELGALRKRVQKASAEALTSGDLLSQAIDVITTPQADGLVLEILSLHLTIYRQLRFVFESGPSQATADLVHERLAPALVPSQACADLIMFSLESSVRTQNLRATEALSAAARMVDVLPPPTSSSSATSNPLVPLFRYAASSSTLGRSEMIVVNVLLPHVTSTAFPDDLTAKLMAEMDNLDLASIRCNILANILLRRSASKDEEETLLDKEVLGPILHLFDEEDSTNSTTLLNLTRYLLPAIFTARPSSIKTLLQLLGDVSSGKDRFSAWISVASLGVASGHIGISDLPKSDVDFAIMHESPAVRLRVFQLLAGSKHPTDEATVGLVQRSLEYNAVLPSAGARSELLSAVYAYFKKLRETHEAIFKINSSDSRLNIIGTLQNWLLEDFVDTGLQVACRHPVVRSILALGVLKHFLDVFAQDMEVQKQVFTEDRVLSLFACQMSEFTEVRSRARAILEGASIDLMGYERLSSPSTQVLLQSSLASLNHPRRTQAEAGRSALCIVFQKLLVTGSTEQDAIGFVTDLVDRMESHIAMSEQDLPKSIETMPLHGIIAAVRDVISCLKMSKSDSQSAWSPLFQRLDKLVDRVWTVTRSVISLAPSKTADASNPDHEIARAYNVLGGGDEEDGDEAMDHTNLLSGCWRATKEAGELLATLISIPLQQAKNSQTMWSSDQVDLAGKRFLVWMHEIRHRGTFSKISSAFTNLVDAVKGVETLKPLCYSWLQNELDIITTDSLSTTRRSAALPFSVLAIVSADQTLLDKAFERLNELAKVDNSRSSDITKVHAFNILKIVLLDSKQAKLLDRYFERAVMTALHAFSSPNWNVRNVGLILFSTIVHRSLAPGRGTQDYYASKSTLASRQTLANWHNKYPSIIPYITKVIRDLSVSASSTSASINAHSPLFPILIIVRSLRWSPPGHQLAGELEAAVKPLLASKEWQVRMVSAQALSSLVAPERAVDVLLESITAESSSQNERHGVLLLSERLIIDVIDWTAVVDSRKAELEGSLKRLNGLGFNRSPLVAKAVLDMLSGYIQAVTAPPNSIVDATCDFAERILKPQTVLPGRSLLIASAANALLKHGKEERITASLLRNDNEDVQLSALEYVLRLDQATTSHATIDGIIDIALYPSGIATQIAAFETLYAIPLGSPALAECSPNIPLKVAAESKRLALNSKCVPLQEAALALYGYALVWRSTSRGLSADIQNECQELVSMIDHFSEVDKSQPSRYAALLALQPFATLIFSQDGWPLDKEGASDFKSCALHRMLLRLLQDDDEVIRQGATDIVRHGLGLKRGINQKRAMELEFDFIESCVLSSDRSGCWSKLLLRALEDETEFVSELERLKMRPGTTDVLFEVEPPNLFRDPLVEMSLAANTVKRLMKQPDGRGRVSALLASARARLTRADEAVKHLEVKSPIDEKFDLLRKTRLRMDIWSSVL